MAILRAHTLKETQDARRAITRLAGLSDSLFKVGPLKFGLDGVLAWVPGFGEAYSLTAGGLILLCGVRARAPLGALAAAAGLLGLRSLLGAPAAALMGPLYPLSGLAVDLFRGHRFAADVLLRAMDRTLYVEDNVGGAEVDAAERLAQGSGRRLVVLGRRRPISPGSARTPAAR
jgi:hypothetical protein